MTKIFISYCHDDDRKREILQEVLEKHSFTPVVVANSNQPTVRLTQKVKDGIKEADYLMPILTENSIGNQWVNQEIGYAEKLCDEKKIEVIPIVEDTIFQSLKGFINNQIDLPFNFKNHPDQRIENKRFKAECERVIEYLKTKKIPSKGAFSVNGTFSHLSGRGLTSNDFLQLISSITLENVGEKNITISLIEISFTYPWNTGKGIEINTFIFFSDYIIQDSKTISLKSRPIILKPQDIKHFDKMIFTSYKPLPNDTKIEIRDNLYRIIKDSNSVKAKFRFLSGEEFEKELNIIHK